ncbi:MAG: hypothetical protein ACLGI7_05330, partial [Gammaproteobacteria bacterium]
MMSSADAGSDDHAQRRGPQHHPNAGSNLAKRLIVPGCDRRLAFLRTAGEVDMTGSEGGRATDAASKDRAAAKRRIVEAACALIAGGHGAAMIDAAALQAAGVCGRGECEQHFIDSIELRSALF